jgi:thiamine-phosphate pyrophosphorylase
MPTDHPETSAPPPPGRLYVVVPPVEDPGGLVAVLDAALDIGRVAAVLLRLPPADEDGLVAYARPFASVVQDKGIALLLDGHPEIAARIGADGAHLTGLAAYTAAAPRLKPDRIAGAGGLKTRHNAMVAAESGADYVMFGEPLDSRRPDKSAAPGGDGGPERDEAEDRDRPPAGGRRPPIDAVVERVAWWAELFEVPCVAYAENLDEVSRLAAAGADFVAVSEFVFTERGAASTMIRVAAERLANAASAAADRPNAAKVSESAK